MKAIAKRNILIWVILTALMIGALPVYAANEVKTAGVSPAPTTPVTLELKAADIRDVLQLLAKLSGINVVADKGVSGEVSVSLQNVPFDQALDMVVRANGFSYRWVGDVLLVAAEDRMVQALEEPVLRTFNLQYLDPAEAVAAISLVVDKSNIVADSGSRTLIVKAIPSQLTTVAKLLQSLDVVKPLVKKDLITKVLGLQYTDPDTFIQTIKGSLDSSTLLVPRNKAVVFRGTQEQLAVVTELLETIDRRELAVSEEEQPQTEDPISEVLVTKVINLNHISSKGAIEALSLIVSAEALKEIQPDRQIAMRGTNEEISEGLRIISEIDFPAYQVLIEARVEEISVTALKSMGIDWNATTNGLTLTQNTDITKNNFSLAKVGPNVEATLRVLEENGDSTVLANPRVAVIDGDKAKIHIGDKIPIVIDKKDTDQNGNIVITTSVEYIDVGIILEVLPRINREGSITAIIKPEVSTIVDQTPQGYPQIRTRMAETRMTLTNGETMVLGGLIQEEEVDTVRKVPVLGDLPVLGSLFKTKTTDTKQTEIVIFLTPTIIPIAAN